ncbi:uncharacterized protein LOC111027745 [Myzus persicae]|uniref:uncharacterized protein LOC111027745 n=1 Tax=Myzus persicae TaxID=13164 RepID=UPI000B935D3C|nr:uncharacterized protein LOC111027745 [Myzus persicae]
MTIGYGRAYVEKNVLFPNVKKNNIGTAPWYVAIYKLMDMWRIIYYSKSARCVQKNDDMLSELISVNNGLYRIAVGKYTKDIKDIKVINSEFIKIINVEMIYLNEHHTPLTLSYAERIAIIVLQN